MGYIPKHLLSDDIIFHYTTANTAIQHILFENRLRLSPRSNSADPIEHLNFRGATLFWGEHDEILSKLGGEILDSGKKKWVIASKFAFVKTSKIITRLI